MDDVRRIIFPAVGRVSLEECAPLTAPARQVLVKTRVSLVSNGTELAALNGTYADDSPWAEWIRYPFEPGYAAVGEVLAPACDGGPPAGSLVALRAPHASAHVVDADSCHRVPLGIDPESASWFALAKIAFRAMRAAGIGIGSSVAVVGAGPVGQMAVRWAVAGGARDVVVVDPAPQRVAVAIAGGATRGVVGLLEDMSVAVRDGLESGRLEAVIDTTAAPAAIGTALTLVDDGGAVVLLSDGGHPERIQLTSDLMFRSVRLVGAFDEHDQDGMSEARIVDLFFALVKAGRFPVEGLVGNRFEPARCDAAYAAVMAPDAVGVLFEWA